jgi:hypothetical protein
MRASSTFFAARLGFAALLLISTPTYASAEALAGSWSGTGSVTLPSGATEKARCKVSFNKKGGKTYGMDAVCASSSARVAQSASLEQVGTNKYAGNFTNTEYNVSGTINVTVNGGSLSAALKGGGGSAFFNLSR